MLPLERPHQGSWLSCDSRIAEEPRNSYSYEFTAYLYEFCERIAGDSLCFQSGAEKSLHRAGPDPSLSLSQIYTMFPYFGNKLGPIRLFRVVEVTSSTAAVGMRFTERRFGSSGPIADGVLVWSVSLRRASWSPWQIVFTAFLMLK